METIELFTKISSMKYRGRGQVRENIYHMNIIAMELGYLGMQVLENMQMEFFRKSFPLGFGHYKVMHNIQEHKWSLQVHTSLCAQEEI